MKTYFKGNKAEYTGKSEMVYGGKFFEIRLLDGHEKGKLKWTSKCPNCGLREGQDKRIPFQTCQEGTK